MTTSVTVAEGRVVLDASGNAAPQGAFDVDERDMFWSRLLRDGDVVPAKADRTASKAQTAPAIPSAEKVS